MGTKQPAILAAARNAAEKMARGEVRGEMLQRMQAVLFGNAQAQAQAQALASRLGRSGSQSQPGGMQGLPQVGSIQGPGQGQGPGPGQGVGGAQPGQQPMMGVQSSNQSPGSQTPSSQRWSQPPPTPSIHSPHTALPPQQQQQFLQTQPDSPVSHSRRKDKSATMAPPSWIPSHLAPGPGTPVSGSPSANILDSRGGEESRSTLTSSSSSSRIPIKEWESHLRQDMPVTKITPLPISSTKSSTATSGDVKVIEEEEEDPTFGGLLPKLSEKEIQFIADSLKADVGFYEREKSNRKKIQKRIERIRNP